MPNIKYSFKPKKLAIRISEELYARLNKKSVTEGKSKQDIITYAIIKTYGWEDLKDAKDNPIK